MRYYIVEKKNHNALYAILDYRENADHYLRETLPEYIRRGYLMDKSLSADDFEIIEKGER